MDHRNKIQSLVLPKDDPGDAPDCMCEYGPCTCEYGRMCHTAPTAEKYGVSLEPTLHLGTVKKYAIHKIWPAARKPQKSPRWARKRVENKKMRKSAIFQSLMRGTAKRHGFLHIGAHLVAKGVLGHMGWIHPIFTCVEGKSANFSK